MFHAPCEWSLAPPHHILPLSQRRTDAALGRESSEHMLVGCLLGARDALVPSEVPALTMFTAYPASLLEQHTSRN